jgi:uncharacterized coiled-coil DUF342 family protein
MANAVQTKLQKISGEYSAKVEDIRDLRADLRKPFVTDAEAKVINTQIKKLDQERLKLNTKLNELTKLAKTAEEYIKLNKEFNNGSWKANNQFHDIINMSNIYKIIKNIIYFFV